MKQYIDLIEHVLYNGKEREDRTGTGTIGTFGYQMRFNLNEGFPLLTTKKLHFKSVAAELMWFLRGETNIRPLVINKVRIWNEWAYKRFQQSSSYRGESMEEFLERIVEDEYFASEFGDLGPVYGKQWRDFGGVDQIANVIESIKQDPVSRRHIVMAWNPPEVKDMALPPCHMFFQFYVEDRKLSLQLYQRSADVFLGVPFNIASYALLLVLVAQETGLKPHEFIHTFGDVHIYKDHIEQVNLQIKREPRDLPKLVIKNKRESIFDYQWDDFEIVDYNPHPHIAGKVSV